MNLSKTKHLCIGEKADELELENSKKITACGSNNRIRKEGYKTIERDMVAHSGILYGAEVWGWTETDPKIIATLKLDALAEYQG